MAVAQKQTPATNPTLAPDIHEDGPILPRRIASPIVQMSIIRNDVNIIPATPFFAFGSSILTAVSLIHEFLNRNEYQIAPSTKKATAATNTASQLMSEKIAVPITVSFVRRAPSEVIIRKDKSFFRIDQ